MPLRNAYRAALTALTLLVAASSAVGCAGPEQQVGHYQAPSQATLIEWVQGPWEMLDAAGEQHGKLRLEGRRVMAWAGGTMLLGEWHIEPSESLPALELSFSFDEIMERGVRVRTDQPRVESFTLLAISDEEVIALQSDGLWLRWQRPEDE